MVGWGPPASHEVSTHPGHQGQLQVLDELLVWRVLVYVARRCAPISAKTFATSLPVAAPAAAAAPILGELWTQTVLATGDPGDL